MNYGQLVRAVEMVLEAPSSGELDDETPVRICIDGEMYKDIIAVYPDDMNGRLVVIIEAGR